MEGINLGLTLLIVLFSIANLVIEMNDNITKQYEIVYRIIYGTIAISSLIALLYNMTNSLLSCIALVLLIIRYVTIKEHLNHE